MRSSSTDGTDQLKRDEPDLPEILKQQLDPEVAKQILTDIEGRAQIDSVQLGLKGVREPKMTTVEEALVELDAGRAQRVLMRYWQDDNEWWDTLIANEGGFLLVRVCHGPRATPK